MRSNQFDLLSDEIVLEVIQAAVKGAMRLWLFLSSFPGQQGLWISVCRGSASIQQVATFSLA